MSNTFVQKHVMKSHSHISYTHGAEYLFSLSKYTFLFIFIFYYFYIIIVVVVFWSRKDLKSYC